MFLLLFLISAIVLAPAVMLGLLRIRRVEAVSPFELGTIFAAIVATYALLPLGGFVLSGNSFDLSVDARLNYLSTEAGDVLAVGILYAAFLWGFCSSYGLLRPSQRVFRPGDVVISDPRLPSILVGLAVCIVLLPAAMKWMLGVQSSEDYLGTYLELEGQPLWLRQVFGVVLASGPTMVIAALASALAYRRGLVLILATGVAAGVTLAMFGGGSRTAAMAAVLSAIVIYSFAVRPISIKSAALLGSLMLCTFVALQYLRDFLPIDSYEGFAGLLVNGEFASLFFNGLDLMQQREWLEADSTFPNFYAVDVGRLIPQQLLPFEKVDPSRWYVTTLYPGYAGAGGGLAFGAISESALGYGAPEALLRGGLLGALFSVAHKVLTAPGRQSLIRLVAYTWLVVFSYQSFRDTTFSLVARFAFNAVPGLILIATVELWLRRSRSFGRSEVEGGQCS